MSEKSITEISTELLEELRRFAEEQGRSEVEVLEEAVARHLERLRGAGADVPDWVGEPTPEERPRDGFLALIDRMSSRFDLDEEEAMRIAVEEQHAARQERREKAER